MPPTDKFPTHMTGKLKAEDPRSCLSNKKFRIETMQAYIKENGNRRILIGFNRGSLKFIDAHGSDTKI